MGSLKREFVILRKFINESAKKAKCFFSTKMGVGTTVMVGLGGMCSVLKPKYDEMMEALENQKNLIEGPKNLSHLKK